MPELCGSTRPRAACTATAASTAEPPRLNTERPASTARGWAAATMPVSFTFAVGAAAGAFASRARTGDAGRARARTAADRRADFSRGKGRMGASRRGNRLTYRPARVDKERHPVF